MRRLYFAVLIIMILGVCSAGAETAVSLSADTLFSGQELDFLVSSDRSLFVYTVSRDDKKLFSSAETTSRTGAYIPRDAGDYVLEVTAKDGSGPEETVSVPFEVYGVLECEVKLSSDRVTLGEPVRISVENDLDPDDTEFFITVLRENDIVWRQTGKSGLFSYQPRRTGHYTVSCTLKHVSGHEAESDDVSFDVLPGSGISCEGEGGVFYVYGGIHSLTVHSGGIWTAECDDDHFLLDRTAGADGDIIHVCALPDGSVVSGASLRISTINSSLTVPLGILDCDSLEEEILLDQDQPKGSNVLTIVSDAASYTVGVESDLDDWHAVAEEGEAVLFPMDRELTIDLPEGRSDHVTYTHIRISDGTTDGHVSIFRLPDTVKPFISDEITTDKQNYTAYQDSIVATFSSSANTDHVLIKTDWGLDLTADRGSSMDENGIWRVRIPAFGSGKKRIMLTPVSSDQVCGDAVCTSVRINPEKSGAVSAECTCDNGSVTATVITTSATGTIILKNDLGQLRVTKSDVAVDHYISEDNNGRYIRWMIETEGGEPFTQCEAGGREIPVTFIPSANKNDAAVSPVKPYDQLNGTWKYVAYKNSELQKSGCAIFALSTALKILGHEGIETEPGRLAEKYRFCLVEGGTLNSTLIGNAGKEFGFRTRYDLYNTKGEVLGFFERGAVFSFSVVKGHIALTDRISEDGEYFHVMDSALSATFSRIKGTEIYRLADDGRFVPVQSPEEIEGARYFIETDAFSGGQYWLRSDYVLRRGVRLILPKEPEE